MRMNNPLARWGALLAGLALIWLFMFQAGPALTQHSSAFRQYAAHVDELDFNTGAIYYTDVEIVAEGDLGYRTTVEYTPRGPALIN
ncbi:hypothetical protein V6C53_03120 [Desulfocurvibacter africanus]|uniref:hypothetical protein n=1 Tax=Desulfocurvibacter africanus TaxID=873 RepID=UPI0004067CB7|nr:hypothetical protein [Desulfocurvibacter africanus]